jgi:transcriptional regulator with XRE-family HTH domain
MLASRGMTQVEIAKELGVSHVTLAKRMGELRVKEGPLKEYRCLLGLQLTALQCRSLEALTPEKLNGASLIELARAFSFLKKAELLMEGKPTKIRGILAYLLEMEKEDKDPLSKS